MFLVEGDHLVRMAMEANCLTTLLVSEEELENYLDIIDEEKTIIVTESIINKLSFTKSPQNVIGVAKQNIIEIVKEETLEEKIEENDKDIQIAE